MKNARSSIQSLLSSIALTALLAGIASTNASAIQYDATAALDGGGHDHAIWIPSLGFVKNDFSPVPGLFTENYGLGTATLTGTALNAGGDGFIIDALFSGYVPNSIPNSIADAPPNSPKVEEDGSDKGNWWYYTSTMGTLTGVGSFAGDYFTFDRMGPSFQVGNGASGKNSGFGASGWLSIYKTNSDFERVDNYSHRGDFNLDLESVPDAGSTILLFGTALGLIALASRRLS